MTGSRTYILRVLTQLDRRLAEEGYHHECGVVQRVASDLSDAQNMQAELEKLLLDEDLEQFAVGLMWLHSRERTPLNGIQSEVMNHEVETLRRILLADPDDHPIEPGSGPGQHRTDALNPALVDFSRLVADLRRRVTTGEGGQGFSEELAWRVLDQVSTLRQAAQLRRHREVVQFCDAMTSFLDYVVQYRIFSDSRVLAVIDNANRTLQTVVAGGIRQEQESLEHTIALLKHSSTFFGK